MKIFIRYIILFIAVGIFSSCKKYLDVNDNPNSATTPPLNGMIITTTQSTGLNSFRVADITSYYVQYLASSGVASGTDVYDEIDASNTWTMIYDNLTDLYDLHKLSAELGDFQKAGIAKIMSAMNLQLAHNLWGSVPFSDAFTGTILTPTYDDAHTVFDSCIALLDDGITLLQTDIGELDSDADLIHGGDADAWIKTAHAVKARLLNQLSKTAEYNTTAIFAELAAAYTSVADDATMATFDVRNPWNQEAVDNADLLLDGWLSKHYVDAMTGTIYGIPDPRLPLTASLTQFGDYRGTRNGAGRIGTGTDEEESYISLTGFYSSPNSPVYLICFEELKFIEAEAALRQAVPDKARAYAAYLAAITANMNKMGVAPAARDAYINHASVSVGAASMSLDLLFKEKYKALFLTPVTWDDARRHDYGYAAFQLPLNVVTPTYVRRLVYPSVETTRNSANVPAVTDVTEKLWWDQ